MSASDSAISRHDAELLEAVKNLTTVVQALDTTLKEDYPKRSELERKYVTYQQVKQRRIQIAAATVIAIALSYFFAVSTVTYCYHGGQAGQNYKPVCSIFPGYNTYQNGNKQLIDDFHKLQQEVQETENLVQDLDAKVN